VEQQRAEPPFSLSEQQHPIEQEQQHWFPFGAPLNSVDCETAAEQIASLQKDRVVYKLRF